MFRPLCVQLDQWVTQGGGDPLPLEEEHCSAVEVTEEDIQNSVKFVPSLSAVVSILWLRRKLHAMRLHSSVAKYGLDSD